MFLIPTISEKMSNWKIIYLSLSLACLSFLSLPLPLFLSSYFLHPLNECMYSFTVTIILSLSPAFLSSFFLMARFDFLYFSFIDFLFSFTWAFFLIFFFYSLFYLYILLNFCRIGRNNNIGIGIQFEGNRLFSVIFLKVMRWNLYCRRVLGSVGISEGEKTLPISLSLF